MFPIVLVWYSGEAVIYIDWVGAVFSSVLTPLVFPVWRLVGAAVRGDSASLMVTARVISWSLKPTVLVIAAGDREEIDIVSSVWEFIGDCSVSCVMSWTVNSRVMVIWSFAPAVLGLEVDVSTDICAMVIWSFLPAVLENKVDVSRDIGAVVIWSYTSTVLGSKVDVSKNIGAVVDSSSSACVVRPRVVIFSDVTIVVSPPNVVATPLPPPPPPSPPPPPPPELCIGDACHT